MITYQDIYEAAKKERYSESLQPISKSFVKDVAKYLKEKREVAIKEEDVFSDVLLKTKKQLENAITLFQELLRRRRKKILNLVLIASETGISKQDFDNMLLIEKDLFEDLMKCIEKSDKLLNNLLNGDKTEEEQNHSLIVFSDDIGEFTAPSGEGFGPYEAGQLVNLDKDLAAIFVGDGKAEYIER
jgi:DNA replication initiation complex subunit (GINS family)